MEVRFYAKGGSYIYYQTHVMCCILLCIISVQELHKVGLFLQVKYHRAENSPEISLYMYYTGFRKQNNYLLLQGYSSFPIHCQAICIALVRQLENPNQE